MSRDAQLPIPHDKGTSGDQRVNLDPIMTIMQELHHMRKEMIDMRRDMTNLSMVQRGQNQGVGNITPNTQRGYGNFTLYGPYDVSTHSTYQFHDGGRHATSGERQGGLGGRGINRPHEEFQTDEAWQNDNLSETMVDILILGKNTSVVIMEGIMKIGHWIRSN